MFSIKKVSSTQCVCLPLIGFEAERKEVTRHSKFVEATSSQANAAECRLDFSFACGGPQSHEYEVPVAPHAVDHLRHDLPLTSRSSQHLIDHGLACTQIVQRIAQSSQSVFIDM